MLTSVSFGGVDFRGLNDVAYRAKDVDIATKSLAELSKEDGREILDLGLGSGVKIIFEDALSKSLVSLNLSERNFNALRENFKESNNFYQKEDGSFRLNGEAENFISAWFYDFAYELNFLGADRDKNKLIDSSEAKDAYTHASLVTFGANSVSFSYLGKQKYGETHTDLSIEAGMNYRIERDKNFDKEIRFSERFTQKELNTFAKIAQNLAEGKGGEEIKLELKEDLLQKALSEGLSSLSQKELAEFKLKYPKEFENLKQEQTKSELSKDFLKQFLNDNFKMLDKSV